METQTQTVDEQAGQAWWNTLNQAERAQALTAAVWTPHSWDRPSVSDCWTVYKQRSHTAAAGRKPLRYVVLIGRYRQPPFVFDVLTKSRIRCYPTVAEAEQQAMLLNQR